MKVTIGDDFLTVEGAPTPEAEGLTDEQLGVLALVMALAWAMGRIAETAEVAEKEASKRTLH